MKFKFKALVAAVALAAVAGQASANTIDGTAASGGLFFNVYDGSSSYSLNLGYTIDSFASFVAANTTGFDLQFGLASDVGAGPTLASYMTGKTGLQFNLMAADISGARRDIQTYSTLPGTTITADVAKTAVANVWDFANNGVNLKLDGTKNAATFTTADYGYAGKASFADTVGGFLNFSNAGTVANNSYANGLNLMTINSASTGIAASTYSQYFAGVNPVKVYVDANDVLHLQVAAVPEPETYGLMAGGLLMLGAIARRRKV